MNDNDPSNSDRPPASHLPQLRPYQIPAAEMKARDDKEAAERQERIEELREESEQLNATGKKRGFWRSFGRFMAWMLLIVVLTTGGGFAGWHFLLRQKTPVASPEANKSQQAIPPVADAKVDIKHYQSPNSSLELDYPRNWIITDNATKLTIVSPAMQLKPAVGSKQSGQITFTIQNRQASIPAFKSGNATAVHESERIAYAKPSQTQRANSYLSFLGYADSNASSSKGLDGVYVTGDNGYQIGQAIPLVDIAKADPLITATFTTCSDIKCATIGKPLTLDASVWADASFSKPIKSLVESIIVQ